MNFGRSYITAILVMLCSVILLDSLSSLSWADQKAGSTAGDPAIEALMSLHAASEQERQRIYDLLAKEGDDRLVPMLEAYTSGLLENRDGKPVIYGASVAGPDNRKLYPLIDALTGRHLVDENGKQVFAEKLGPSMIKAPREDRKVVATLIKRLSLQHSDIEKRVAAIRAAGDRADTSLLPVLQQQLQSGPPKRVAQSLTEAVARIQLVCGDQAQKIQAAQVLGGIGSQRAGASLRKVLQDETSTPELKAAAENALKRIEKYQWVVKGAQNLFSGLSLGSILILMALGLAVIFGLMGVINMAHGEFMMLGAFTAFVVCELFKKYLPEYAFNYYFICAVPASFAVSAMAGWLCEWALIRHLYGRPLETLLATWGLSLVMIQAIRVLFGDTLALTPPDWFKGSWELAEDLALPLNRLFIIVFCGLCASVFYLVVHKTKLGLLLRATVQDRDTAASLGVGTRRVDGSTFALGTGLAGLAGCVIPLYDKINPGMGQGYVVDSFMVVVLGGLGKLAGVIVGGVGLGFLSKFVEPFLEAVYGKVLVLAVIVCFLQWRPAGLFPSRGRLAEE